MKAGAVIAAWLLAPGVLCAQALYRPDQPPVLEREAVAPAAKAASPDDATVARFTQAYAAAGRPRILVLWHRGVGDRITDEQQLERSAVSAGLLARDNLAQQVVIRWKGRPEQPASFLPPARAADYEAGLTSALLQAGVRLVDRSMALRMTALKATEGGRAASSLEVPTVEAQSFADMAEQVLQVQLLPDPASPQGWNARLTLIEVRSGVILVDSLRGEPGGKAGQGERVWVATDKGFSAQRKSVSLAQLARKDAWQLLQFLGR